MRFLSFIKAKIGTKLLKVWDLLKRETEVKLRASSSNLAMLQNIIKVVENMCIFIKFSLKNGTEPLKKRDSNIF